METRVPSLPLLFSRQKLFYVLFKNFWLMRYFSIKMAQWNAPHLGSSKCPKLASSLRLTLDKPELSQRPFQREKAQGNRKVDPPGQPARHPERPGEKGVMSSWRGEDVTLSEGRNRRGRLPAFVNQILLQRKHLFVDTWSAAAFKPVVV